VATATLARPVAWNRLQGVDSVATVSQTRKPVKPFLDIAGK
jgi:hypothetical protein